MKLKLLIAFILFTQLTFSQTTSQALEEAQKRNITSQQQVLQELSKNGISEDKARQMARVRGIDFDTFLSTYFTSGSGSTSPVVVSNDVAPVATSLNQSAPVVFVEDSSEEEVEALRNTLEKESKNFFGYDIFLNNPFTEKEYLVGNIDEGYIIAPGDVLRLAVFGDNSMDLELTVDLNGNIRLPNMGVFLAAGNSFKTLKERLQTYLGKFLSGLLNSPQKTFLDVSLTQIRPVKVTVLGEVSATGSHLVNGLATPLNALYAAGGIKTSGTLRSVQIFRNNKLLEEIDLYQYITTGKIKNDVRLSNNDVVFVGPRISSISLSGQVKNSGVYEMKEEENLQDLIKFSGGLPTSASLNNFKVTRVKPFKDRAQSFIYDRFVTSVNYNNVKEGKNEFKIEDGDGIEVSKILDKVKNTVTINGHVNAPGVYDINTFSDLKTLIDLAAKQIRPNTYLNKVDIFKEDFNGDKSFVTYNLKSVLDGEIKVVLEENDSIKIYSETEVIGENRVSISGYVSEPTTVFWREDLSLFDLIFQTTSFEETVFQSKVLKSRVDVKRWDESKGQYRLFTYRLENLNEISKVMLAPKDKVVLYSESVTEVLDKTVRVVGFVKNPTEIALQVNMYIEDAIIASGGFEAYADQEIVSVSREALDVAEGKMRDYTEIRLDIDYLKGLKEAPEHGFILEDNDIVVVRKPSGAGVVKSINVSGEVFFPQSVILDYDLVSLESVINKAGGLKPTANLDNSFIIRNGRNISYDFKKALKNKEAILEIGDEILIGDSFGYVQTQGAVEFPSQFIIEPNRRAKYYIRNSGGKLSNEVESMYISYKSGRSKKIGFLKNPKVLPESTIVVNRKTPKVKNEKDNSKFADNFIKVFGFISSTLTTILLVQKL